MTPYDRGGSRQSRTAGRPSTRAANHARVSSTFDAYSSEQDRYSRSTRAYKARKPKSRKVIAIVAIAIVACLALAGTALALWFNSLSTTMTKGTEELSDTLTEVEAGDPFYVLLLGVDRSQERAEGSYAGDNFRSDSMILAKIDPQQKKVWLISIHRDTYVDIHDGDTDYGYMKINAAHAVGGPELAVKAVEELAGVKISHYAEIDFDGFEAMVDALGGVEVTVPIDINDDQAGGSLSAGTQTLNGEQALILCRSRHAYDDYGDGDLYRAANQRMVLGAMAKKMLSGDVTALINCVNAAADYITTDMTVDEIISVGESMMGINLSEDLYSIMCPTESSYVDDTWYENVSEEAWKVIMDRVEAGLSPTEDDTANANEGGVVDGSVDGEYVVWAALNSSKADSSGSSSSTSSSVTVDVLNGNGVEGSATEASEKIADVDSSVTIGNLNDADSYDYSQTLVIYHDSAYETLATSIVEALGSGRIISDDSGDYEFDGDIEVIVGQDFAS